MNCLLRVVSAVLGFGFLSVAPAEEKKGFRAGASVIDITPTEFPVIQNGGFLEGRIQLATEKLHARCLVLDDGPTRFALVVVDSCMIPRTLCDEVKSKVSASAGLAKDRIMISATHTHSAPSVMNYCLGSRADPKYTRFLVPKLVQVIETAAARLEPAEAAWASVDAGEYTNCRRWITRSDKMQTDPFGERTVRAMMHPGYQNPDFVGPSGPEDPWLSFLSVRRASGVPLALFGNFAMHYFSGHAGASADYFGHFNRQLEERMNPEEDQGGAFVGLLSQGTSGDLWWADYGQSKVDREIKGYAAALVELVGSAYDQLEHRRDVSLAMAEKRFTLDRRVPSDERLAWAKEKLQAMEGRRPRNRPEVYAEQAVYIHENPREEIVLQAIRIGELGIATMPNEVYGITGLKVRLRSPLTTTFTIELANGAAGYIPPPEQHALGGYNAWPARTAGLEVEAEPKITEGVLALLEEVSGRPRQGYVEPSSPYAKAVLDLAPALYWGLGELEGTQARDAGPRGLHGRYEGLVAYHLPGAREGQRDVASYASRAVHLAGGVVTGDAKIFKAAEDFTVTWEFWNGVTGGGGGMQAPAILLQLGNGLRLGIGADDAARGRLFVQTRDKRVVGKSDLASRQWHHIVVVSEGGRLRAYLDGNVAPEIEVQLAGDAFPGRFSMGQQLEGRLDEVAIFDRALNAEERDRLSEARRK